ncbi:hypothetical protein GGR57DRAFT_288235 [Xylariaceae sp. FL1272]|nr:hypothetical protein GGR57DRAFT_288235 [Xylariaceae sp. FL1272]
MVGLPDIPLDLLLELCRRMDRDALARISQTNKALNALVTPMLWRNIDFVALRDESNAEDSDIIEEQGRFFRTCNLLMDAAPARWDELARLVRRLRLVKTPSFRIPVIDTEDNGDWGWLYLMNDQNVRSIFHVFACLKNLEDLHFYIKESLDYYIDVEPVAVMRGALSNLKTVQIGGNLTGDMIVAILSQPETVESLTCVNLQDGEAGQEYHSNHPIFFHNIAHRFLRLESLHLSMLAELSGNSLDTGLRWDWDQESDIECLEDWATLLRSVAPTLVELTLESSYLCSYGTDEVSINYEEEDDGDTSRWAAKGAASSQRFRKVILPALAAQDWPKLRSLTFAGVHVGLKALAETGVLERCNPDVNIKLVTGLRVHFSDIMTPINISPPNGSTFQDVYTQSEFHRKEHIISEEAILESLQRYKPRW